MEDPKLRAVVNHPSCWGRRGQDPGEQQVAIRFLLPCELEGSSLGVECGARET